MRDTNKNLFLESIKMKLSAHEVELVTRAVVGGGGAQGLLRHIIGLLETTGELELEDSTLHTVHKYAYGYGNGGFEDRFRAVMAAATRAGWAPR